MDDMTDLWNNLAWNDRTILTLRALYEQYGYQQYHMGKFEPYDLYRENRSFLKSETIITFTDASGRLMALKPDVTMSIIKSTQPEMRSRKLYYVENVFRMPPGSNEYREISQVGLECIGGEGDYPELEVVLMALKTLECIDDSYLLSVGHMGFVSAVFNECGFDEETYAEALNALTHKNLHLLRTIEDRMDLSAQQRMLLETMVGMADPLKEGILKLRALELTSEMQDVLEELNTLRRSLKQTGYDGRLVLDFSFENDMDYYNGIVFQGFIEKLPRAVLSGGRYDNLMLRFAKPQRALGFALYLGELTRAFLEPREYDADVLLLYGEAEPDAVIQAVGSFIKMGMVVRAEKTAPAGFRARQVLRLGSDSKVEVMGE